MFTLKNIYPVGNQPYHPCMLKTIEDIRLDNLKTLLEPRGAARRIANALGKEPNYISQVKTGKKGFSSEMARAIEAAEGLDAGWMDHIHGDAENGLAALPSDDEISFKSMDELAEKVGQLGADELHAFIAKALAAHKEKGGH